MQQALAHDRSLEQPQMGQTPGAGSSDQMIKKRESKPPAPPMSSFEEPRHDALGAQDRRSNIASDAASRKYPSLR